MSHKSAVDHSDFNFNFKLKKIELTRLHPCFNVPSLVNLPRLHHANKHTLLKPKKSLGSSGHLARGSHYLRNHNFYGSINCFSTLPNTQQTHLNNTNNRQLWLLFCCYPEMHNQRFESGSFEEQVGGGVRTFYDTEKSRGLEFSPMLVLLSRNTCAVQVG